MTLVSDDAIADRLYRDNYKTIRQYVDILVSRGVDWGLIGPREIGRLWERHILNSIAPVSYTHLTLPTNREV